MQKKTTKPDGNGDGNDDGKWEFNEEKNVGRKKR